MLAAFAESTTDAALWLSDNQLQALQNSLGEDGRGTLLDLSMADEMEYYNGLVFTGYVAGVPRAVLKGGRYDYLMQRFTPGANAIGFAMYLDELERLAAPLPPMQQQGGEKTWLNIALPKGRLGAISQRRLLGCELRILGAAIDQPVFEGCTARSER